MKQEKLEQKVREIFERQGFEVEQEGNVLTASNGKEFRLRAFSSEKYGMNDIKSSVNDGDKVFVDEELAGAKNQVENDVSILYSEEENDYDTPSYEVIGDIAVINDLAGIEREDAVEGILAHQNVKTILLKKGGLKGEFRVGEYKKIYGEETGTIHREYGCRLKVDPTEVYYSERFSTERKRIVDQIQDGEKVLVMFAGVGPFAIMAAKLADPRNVVAVEKNPEAAEYLEENIELNGVEHIVEGMEGDVSDIVPDLGKFDRIIMPLPETAKEFLPLAFEHLEDDGVIHYYRFVEDDDWKVLEREVADAAAEAGTDFEILDEVICGERGPSVSRACLDIKKVHPQN